VSDVKFANIAGMYTSTNLYCTELHIFLKLRMISAVLPVPHK